MEDSQLAYLIGSYEVRPVKIGISFDPEERLKSLSAGSPVNLHLMWSGPGGRGLEAALHEYFSPYRLHGEWFDFGAENAVHLVVAAAARMGYARWPDRCDRAPVNMTGETVEVTVIQGVATAQKAAIPESVYPGEVVRYFASKVSLLTDEAESEMARKGVMAWAFAEVSEGRCSQSQVARLLGVGKATVSRWVNAEPGDVLE